MMMANGFIQLPLSVFVSVYPNIAKQEPFSSLISMLLKDDPDNYFVRFNCEKIEFGFLGDSWLLH